MRDVAVRVREHHAFTGTRQRSLQPFGGADGAPAMLAEVTGEDADEHREPELRHELTTADRVLGAAEEQETYGESQRRQYRGIDSWSQAAVQRTGDDSPGQHDVRKAAGERSQDQSEKNSGGGEDRGRSVAPNDVQPFA